MPASPIVTCTGLLTSVGTEWVRLGSHGAVMWSVSMCVCVCVCVYVHDEVCVCNCLPEWECPSCRSGCAHVGLKCVCACGVSQPSTTCFLDSEWARNRGGQHKLNLPFINLYTCIPQSLPYCARLILSSLPSLHFQGCSSWHFLFMRQSAVERGGKNGRGWKQIFSGKGHELNWNQKHCK